MTKQKITWNKTANKLIRIRDKLSDLDEEIADFLETMEEQGLVYLGY